LSRALSVAAALPEVEAIEPARRVATLNQDGVWVHQSFVGPSPQETPVFDRGIFGCGQIVSVADTGQDYDSCYFDDAANGPPPVYTCVSPPCPVETPDMAQRKDVIYYRWATGTAGEDDTCPTLLGEGSGHGTHTSGSVAGDRSPFADCSGYTSPNRNGGDGQAPGSRLVMIELGDGVEYLNDLGGSIWNIADVAYRTGARIHSFSFGGVCHDVFGQCIEGCELTYDSLARDADLAMWTYPDLLLVNAAGNEGLYCPAPRAVVTPALAKSLLAVGGLEHGVSAESVMAESSRGPTIDGRLRPSVAAQGRSVVSAASDANLSSGNCGTCSLDGTSMAAPTVAGLAALVREYYEHGFHATGTRTPAEGITPTGALLKATLLDGATDIAAAGTDFDSGFGRVLLGDTLAFAGSSFSLRVDDHRGGLTTGSIVTHAYDVAAGEPLRATLVWADYPAEINAALLRVNELKLELVDPNGDTWFQTVDEVTGLPRQTSNPAEPHDDRNTEERLLFEDPIPGRWVVRVVGLDVPWGPQPFALVVRGAIEDCPAPQPPGAPQLDTPADGRVDVSWSAVPGAAAYNVYRSFGSCPGGPWVPVATGVAATGVTDVGVSGGVEYSYVVAATSDAGGACESPPSPCASVVPTGECVLAPEFRGITRATSGGTAACSVDLEWEPASAYCIGDVVYNVYRDTSPDFVPGPASLIASCVAGTTYTDGVNLVHASDYHYAVRAEDSTSGHGGPCRGGNTDANLSRASAAPFGPPDLGTWSDDAGDTGEAKFSRDTAWSIDPAAGDSGSNAYRGQSGPTTCAAITTPVLSLAGPGEGPQLSFSTRHDLDYDPATVWLFQGSVGQVEIATEPDFSGWTRIPLTPDYPNYVDGLSNSCPTTQAIGNYFTGRSDVYETYSASLVNWGGQDVRIRFQLSGDFSFSSGDWWVDDVQVTQTYVPGACSTAASGPPPIPDGASVPGEPLLAEASGESVLLTWDSASCAHDEVNVYSGVLGDFTGFTGGECGLPATGTATVAMPGGSWFLVVATDGVDTDGSWSRDRSGRELDYDGASAVCPEIAFHEPGGVCP
jgi:hypothetical protein